jgi:hypothetical protein
MLWISILLTILLGFSTLTIISNHFSYLEKWGASFLIGIALQVFGMILFQFLGIKITINSIYIYSVCIIALEWIFFLLTKKSFKNAFLPYNPFLLLNPKQVNLPWFLLVSLIIYILWAITEKSLFWPTFEFDAVAGYDLVAKVLAEEGTFKNSLFMSNGISMYNMSLRAVYPPLVSGSFAYAYMSGAELSKIISSLYYISFIALLYGLLRRASLTHLASAFGILLVLFIPEMTSHAALSQTNMPQAVYTSTGLLSLYLWLKNTENNERYLWLSLLLLASNTMARSENILFAFLAGLAVLIVTLIQRTKKQWIHLIIYGTNLLIPFVLWMLFLKINHLKPAALGEGLSLSLAYDANKFNDWWGLLWGYKDYPEGIVMNKNFYALVPHLFFITLLISLVYALVKWISAKEKDLKPIQNLSFLLYISLGPFILYTVFYYFIKYDWDSIRNVMLFSYKRGLFGIMTLFVCFIMISDPAQWIFSQLNIFMFGKRNS